MEPTAESVDEKLLYESSKLMGICTWYEIFILPIVTGRRLVLYVPTVYGNYIVCSPCTIGQYSANRNG